MEIVSPKQIFAVIIAVEKYQFNINPVKYAENDARAFHSWLVNELNVPTENVKLWINQEATMVSLNEELKYEIQNLNEGDQFIFYYAGHGFFANGSNKVTTWDTHPNNIHDTTVALKDILLDQLKLSKCDKSLIFIDACASDINDLFSRDLLAEMDHREFVQFIKSSKYQAMFLSCSPGEKSFPSSPLNHGIWTYHLLLALKGKVKEALIQNRFVTDDSLQNYLKIAVPAYIRNNTKIRSIQTPWSEISSSNTFAICDFGEDKQDSQPFDDLSLSFDLMYFRRIEAQNFKDQKGFKKGFHKEPTYHSRQAISFMNDITESSISEELNKIYIGCKQVLGKRKKDIKISFVNGSGSLDTDIFRYAINTMQHPDDSKQIIFTRTLILRKDTSELPVDFEKMFPIKMDELIIPIDGELDFNEMVDKFEVIENEIGGNLNEDESTGFFEFQMPNGVTFNIDFETSELSIEPLDTKTFSGMLNNSQENLSSLTKEDQKAIE